MVMVDFPSPRGVGVMLDRLFSNEKCSEDERYEPRDDNVFSVSAVAQTIQDTELNLGFVLSVVLYFGREQADLTSQSGDIFRGLSGGDLYVGRHFFLYIQR